jgi:chromosome segregation ATPase
LRAISALESRNEALQQGLNNAREREKIHARLEQLSGGLQMKLDKTQEELAGREMEYTRLQTTLTRKNATIKERNMKIIQIEEENQRLRNELNAEKKKNSTAGRTVKREGDMKPSASGVMNIHAYAAAMGWSNASAGAAARMEEPAHKKRKYTDTSCGGANNPYVIE